jgi:hypothetical protein
MLAVFAVLAAIVVGMLVWPSLRRRPPPLAQRVGEGAPSSDHDDVPLDAGEPRSPSRAVQPQELIDALARLQALSTFAAATVSATIQAELKLTPSENPHVAVWRASFAQGPFASVELREPASTARAQETRLVITLPTDSGVTRAHLDARYPSGRPFQLLPMAMPALETFLYPSKGGAMFVTSVATTGAVETIVLCRGSCT